MGWLIALGLLIAFSAALMNPYGRRLLGVMFVVCMVVAGALYLLIQHAGKAQEQQAADAAAEIASQ